MNPYDVTDACMKVLEFRERNPKADRFCIKMLEVLELVVKQTLILPQKSEGDRIVDPASLARIMHHP
jgi:hypothetical protein